MLPHPMVSELEFLEFLISLGYSSMCLSPPPMGSFVSFSTDYSFWKTSLRYPETLCVGIAKLQSMDQIWPTAYFCMAYKLRFFKKCFSGVVKNQIK